MANVRAFVIAGPSGVGKNAVIRRVMNRCPEVEYPISSTTRKPRELEADGVDYNFLSHDEFMGKAERGEFIEHKNVHGETWYGSDKATYEKIFAKGNIAVKEIDVDGAMEFKKTFGEDVCLIYLKSPSDEELLRRLSRRSAETEEEQKLRFSRKDYEDSMSEHFDLVVVNDDLETTVCTVLDKIRSVLVTQ